MVHHQEIVSETPETAIGLLAEYILVRKHSYECLNEANLPHYYLWKRGGLYAPKGKKTHGFVLLIGQIF